MKKNDWILAVAICAAAGLFFLWNYFRTETVGAQIQIKVDGTIQGVYSLLEDQEIPIGSTNVLVIKDGKAKMKSADCPDQICVHQKAVSRKGETIVCLPNKVIVEVTEGSRDGLDAVAG